MKSGLSKPAENCASSAVLSGIHSRPNENTSEERIPKSRRVSLPLFIERRLLCALREQRQGNPPIAAHHRPRISATRARLVKTRPRADRSSARQTHDCRALRSLRGDDPASEAENHRAKIAHHSPDKKPLAYRP